MSLAAAQISEILTPFVGDAPVPEGLYTQLAVYLDLLLKWNARTNLTAIRQPEEMVRRHYGESLFAGRMLGKKLGPEATLLDYGSGAGFPGLPIALLLPEVRVTLAESQNKKASFLREAVRVLAVPVEVWARRVEEMPAERMFQVVTLRAVDHMDSALAGARARVAPAGLLAALAGAGLELGEAVPVPGSDASYLYLAK